MDLKTFFSINNKVALAFSGGVDSAYLMYAAVKYGADIKAYYVKSDFQPEFEFEDAKKLADELKVDMSVLYLSVLDNSDIVANPTNRCYYCKNAIFSAIINAAKSDGYSVLMDGTNASDDEGDRPGMKALRELKVVSPLREAGITKSEIRQLSKEAGLFTWDKPAYACLATRIKTGEALTKEKLVATENAEDFLFSLGFEDFRVRMIGDSAKLQFKAEQMQKAFEKREDIVNELRKYYSAVTMDMEAR